MTKTTATRPEFVLVAARDLCTQWERHETAGNPWLAYALHRTVFASFTPRSVLATITAAGFVDYADALEVLLEHVGANIPNARIRSAGPGSVELSWYDDEDVAPEYGRKLSAVK